MSDTASSPSAAWEDPPKQRQTSDAPVLAVDGFDGPLDWLLELVRTQRIDLRKLSIAQLVDAFAHALEAALSAPGRPDLSRWGEFLSMAAQLALLRSRLLLPVDAPGADAARRDAEALRQLLLEREASRRAAAWLEGRVQLGRDVFTRGEVADAERTATSRTTDITDLLLACLVVLAVPEHADTYAPAPPPLWRVSDALARMTRQLADGVRGELRLFLPAIRSDAPARPLRCRAALASTFLASLELCREGAVRLEQDRERIWIGCAPSAPVE